MRDMNNGVEVDCMYMGVFFPVSCRVTGSNP